MRVEWRAVLDQLRAEINSQPAIASRFTLCQPAPRARVGIRARRPALVQLNAVTSPIFARHRAQPGAGAVAVRYRRLSRSARQSGAPDSLSVSRYQADFRPADLFHAGPAGYDAVFSLEPGAGEGMPQRTFAQPVEVQIIRLDPDLRPQRSAWRQGRTGQGAGRAIPRSAPLHPRRLCALRLHPLRRALCGLDPVP